MARKNNPKQTVKTILEVSAKLFLEKGYENTSLQDIVTLLGMSRGAVFHHFKSKEDIFRAVVENQAAYAESIIHQWIDELKGLTAKEKLIAILDKNQQDQRLHSLDDLMASQIQSPYWIVAQVQDCVMKSAPIFADIMREGVQDGSITTEYPDECAEVFFLLMNIWCDQSIFPCDLSKLERRLRVLQQILKQLGADIISDRLIMEYVEFLKQLYEKGSVDENGINRNN